MFDPNQLASPYVRTLAPYVPGKPLEELEREYGIRDSIKLASNENPHGPGPLARAAMTKAAGDIGLYPDGNGFALKQALEGLKKEASLFRVLGSYPCAVL